MFVLERATCVTLLTSVYKLPFLAMRTNASIELATKGCLDTRNPKASVETRERSDR